jgi:hypothetical protein
MAVSSFISSLASTRSCRTRPDSSQGSFNNIVQRTAGIDTAPGYPAEIIGLLPADDFHGGIGCVILAPLDTLLHDWQHRLEPETDERHIVLCGDFLDGVSFGFLGEDCIDNRCTNWKSMEHPRPIVFHR